MVGVAAAGNFGKNLNDFTLSYTDPAIREMVSSIRDAASSRKIPVLAEDLANVIDLVTERTISGNAGKVVLGEMFRNGGKPEEIVKEKNLAQVSDEGFIQETIGKVLSENSREVEQYLAGKETLLQWFMGQVARATKGKADPAVARELLVKSLEEKRN